MFHSARIKLTAWYLFIIMMVSISFSVVIFSMLTREVERLTRFQRIRIERQFSGEPVLPPNVRLENTLLPPLSDPDLVEDTKRRLLFILMVINGTIVFLAGGLGYLLAGKTLKPIADMVEEQNQFITDASHELRTPLTSIKSSIEVNLRDKNLTIAGARKIFLENIEDVNKLQRLSDQLLTLAQFQKPHESQRMSTISVRETIQNALRSVEAVRAIKSINIRDVVKDRSIAGNKEEITNLFVILLDNAIKYSREKSDIILSSTAKNGWIHISVTDRGIGIAKKDLPHIFDRFYRADSARSKTHTDGYGLGLSIAKNITGRYGGSITCQSTQGKGSIFTVSFPIDA